VVEWVFEQVATQLGTGRDPMTDRPTPGDDQLQADVHLAWMYALEADLGPGPGAAPSPAVRQRAEQASAGWHASYARDLLYDLDGDRERIAAVARACRDGHPADGEYATAARLADLALQVLQQAEAKDRLAGRQRLLDELAKARSSSDVDKFIAWLKEMMETCEVNRTQLGQHLGAGAKERIDEDLSGAYLPSWGYVRSMYVGPIKKINEKIDREKLKEQLRKGRELYDTAAAKPSLPRASGDESFSRVVAPIMAALSLPAIVTLATSTSPLGLASKVALSFLIMATGLFLASFQLTIGSLYVRLYHWGAFRFLLSFAGILSMIVALVVLVVAVAGDSWFIIVAIAVLALGGATSILRIGVYRGEIMGVLKKTGQWLRKTGHGLRDS
jgi:hypothetical protein